MVAIRSPWNLQAITGFRNARADDTVKTYTLTVPGDLFWKYGKGMRVRLKQAGIISYFIITGVTYSAPSTTLALYAGTDFSLANSRIIEPYFSMAKAPYGFPVDEAKWRVESLVTTDGSQASPAAGTWYNKGGIFDDSYWSLEGRVRCRARSHEGRGGSH